MRDDLLDAQASVDWAVSNFPAFQERVDSWLRINVNICIEDVPPPATHNPIVAIEKAPLALAFNVEMGAYINAIRSSLDILATSLAKHYPCRISKPESVYFPIAKSDIAFANGNYKGSEFVNGLPPRERSIIESLKPYDGGNPMLWSLHHLDIMRKHRRLIDVDIRPLRFSIVGHEPHTGDFIPVAIGWMRANEKTVLGLIRKGSPDYNMKFIPHVAINESGIVERKPIIAALGYFAGYVTFVIKLFDTP
jgi:hypothetical protein